MTDTSPHDAQRHVWTIGDYPAVARRLLPISIDLLDALTIARGARVLDVGTGDGNAAIEAARRGAHVTALDLTPAQLAKARKRAAEEGVDVQFGEAAAEALPEADASYDAVVSVMAMIFAPDHERAARELARVCRPGGQVAVTSWLNGEGTWFQTWRERVAHLLPAPRPGGPDPDSWGVAGEMQRRFEAVGLAVTVEERPFTWDFASVEDGFDFFRANAGPFVAFFEAMSASGQEDEARATFRGVLEDTNLATDGSVKLSAPYLLAVGRR
jgi:SAM-dependent methyltransferase